MSSVNSEEKSNLIKNRKEPEKKNWKKVKLSDIDKECLTMLI
jgi:hypothetical protein